MVKVGSRGTYCPISFKIQRSITSGWARATRRGGRNIWNFSKIPITFSYTLPCILLQFTWLKNSKIETMSNSIQFISSLLFFFLRSELYNTRSRLNFRRNVYSRIFATMLQMCKNVCSLQQETSHLHYLWISFALSSPLQPNG